MTSASSRFQGLHRRSNDQANAMKNITWPWKITLQFNDCSKSVVINPYHDDVIKWKHFPRYRPFVRGIHRSPVNSPHKGQWRRGGALMFSLICAWINGWVNNREAGDLRRHHAHYDVTVMWYDSAGPPFTKKTASYRNRNPYHKPKTIGLANVSSL